MLTSIFITGASGSGKSTLCEGLIEHGYVPSPNHLTRAPRHNEIQGVHGVFINEDEFRANFHNKVYLEPTLDTAEYSGVLYGSPRCWLEQIATSDECPITATPANVLVLGSLCNELEARRMRERLKWVNLYADIDVRKERIAPRVTDPKDLHVRLTQGVSMGVQPEADINIDTGVHNIEEMIKLAVTLAREVSENSTARGEGPQRSAE